MTFGVDPNDIYHNGEWYSRNGSPLSNGGSPTSLRLIANRCAVPTAMFSFKQGMSRSSHVAADDISALGIVLGLFYGNAGSENTTGLSATTFTASVEFPLDTPGGAGGTYTQLTWGGASSKLYQPFDVIETDIVTLPVTIPKGAKFRIKIWQGSSGATGILACTGKNSARTIATDTYDIDDMFRFGTTIVDQTMTAGMSAQVYPCIVRGFKPLAIIGYTNARSYAIIGDSRAQGWLGDNGPDRCTDGLGFVGQAERVVGPLGYAFTNLAFASDSAVNFTLALAPRRIGILHYVTDIYCEYGINDLAVGTDYGLNSRLYNIKKLAAAQGKSFTVSTLPPSVTGACLLADGSDQTVTANEATRLGWNYMLRSGASCADWVVDVASVVESKVNPGKWISGTRTVSDASATTATYVVNSATAAFTSADIGKALYMLGSGISGGFTFGIIQSVTSTTATINTPIATTVASGGTIYIGDIYTIDGLHESMLANVAIQNANLLRRSI